MLFHPQKDLFHNDAHQALRALFIEKRKRLEMSAEALATKMNCKFHLLMKLNLVMDR